MDELVYIILNVTFTIYMGLIFYIFDTPMEMNVAFWALHLLSQTLIHTFVSDEHGCRLHSGRNH